MNIVVCTDHNYVMPCGVMLHSLLKNNKEHEIVFNVVVDESVTEKDKEELTKIGNQYGKSTIIFHLLDGHLFDNFPNLSNNYITKATYYRLYLTEILPPNLDKVLYLDCDMIVRKDIQDLWDTDIKDVAVAVALDGMDGLIKLYIRLGYSAAKGYFNAGMMLINLKYWREHHILDKCLEYIKYHHNQIISHDQDVLNVILQDSKMNVSISYNFGECFLYKPDEMTFDYYRYKDEIDSVICDPAIVHYTISKPWKDDCLNPFKSVFFSYRKETKWKDCPLQKQKKKRTKKELLKIFLCKLGIIHRDPITPFRKLTFELK